MNGRPTDLYTTITKTDNQTAVQTGKVIWTPASSKRIILQGVVLSVGSTALNIRVQSGGVDIVPPIYLAVQGGATIHSGGAPIAVLAADATLTYTTSEAGPVSIMA